MPSTMNFASAHVGEYRGNGGGRSRRLVRRLADDEQDSEFVDSALVALAQGDGARQADSRAMSSPSIGSTSLMMRSALSAARSGSSVTPSAMPSVWRSAMNPANPCGVPA